MNNNVSWVFEVNIKPGQYKSFKALMEEMVESTQQEPGTLSYEWYIGADQTTCHIYERYIDSDAALVHLGTFSKKFLERFMGAIEPERFVVYGYPSDKVKEALAGIGAEYLSPWGGFAR